MNKDQSETCAAQKMRCRAGQKKKHLLMQVFPRRAYGMNKIHGQGLKLDS